MKHRGGKIQVWGCFTARGAGHIYRIKGIMDQKVYKQILIHHMHPSPGLVVWPIRGQITRFWLLFFLFGLEKKVWPFGYFLASFYFKVMLGKCFDLSLIIYV